MPADHHKANTDIRATFNTRFLDGVQNGLPDKDPPISPLPFKMRDSVATYIPRIVWENVETTDKQDIDKHWLRFTIRNIRKFQASLAGGRQQAVGTRYTQQGIIRVELYIAKSAYQYDEQQALEMITENCFVQVNTPSGVWFRNPMVTGLEPEERFFRSNVIAEFEYETVIK